MTTSFITFIMGIFLIWCVTDSMNETKTLYEILLSTEKDENVVKSQLTDLYKKSKKTSIKYLIIFTILLAASLAVSVTDLIAALSN